MIRTGIEAIPSTVAYELGWADALAYRDVETEAAGEEAATRHARELDGILDRIGAIEPYPHVADQPRLEREDEALALANGWPLRDAA